MAAVVIAWVIVAMPGSALMLVRWATWMWRESGSVALRDRTPFGHLEAGQVADGRDPWMLGEIGQVDGAMRCCRVIAPYCNPDGLGPPVAVFIAWVWLGEVPLSSELLGGAIVIAGVGIISQGPRLLALLRRREPSRHANARRNQPNGQLRSSSDRGARSHVHPPRRRWFAADYGSGMGIARVDFDG
jgi:hypothetical protein